MRLSGARITQLFVLQLKLTNTQPRPLQALIGAACSYIRSHAFAPLTPQFTDHNCAIYPKGVVSQSPGLLQPWVTGAIAFQPGTGCVTGHNRVAVFLKLSTDPSCRSGNPGLRGANRFAVKRSYRTLELRRRRDFTQPLPDQS